MAKRNLKIPERELEWRFSRASGPGGQNVNKTDSRVELIFNVAGTTALNHEERTRALARLSSRLIEGCITIAASEHRSQTKNRSAARARLEEILLKAIKPPPSPRRKTRPTRGSIERRLDSKKRRGEIKKTRRADFD